MKILHVIPAVAPRYGGPSEAIIHMVRALRETGVDASIASTDADGAAGRLSVPLGRTVEYHGVPAVFFARNGGEAAKLSPALGAWLVRHVADYDVVHIHAVFSFACAAAAAACVARGVPYVVRPLGTLDPWSLAQKSGRKRLALAFGGKLLLKRASAIHYTAPQERTSAEGATGLRGGVVIPLGVDPALLAPRTSIDVPPYVLSLGRIHEKKNLPLLIDAFARACESPDVPDSAQLRIAGEGPPALISALQRHAGARGLSRRVQFTGWVTGEKKRLLIGGARVFGMVSFQENFGISAVEALAMGVPVAISHQLDLAEIVDRAGCGWVTPNDPAALGAALASALSDHAEAARRGGIGASHVRQEFEWSRVAHRLRDLYARLAC